MLNILAAYIRLIRPVNTIGTVGAVIVGAAIVTGLNIFIFPVLYASLVSFLIVSGGFAINDYYDYKIDLTEKKHRPIPSGKVPPNNAKIIGYLLLSSGVLLAIATLPILAIYIAGTSAFLLDFYSRVLKTQHTILGNFVTSYSTAITYVFGWSCLLSAISLEIFLTLFPMFIISLFVCLGREFIKSIQDVKGDSKYDIKNIAVRYGANNAAFLATAMIIVAIVISPLPFLFGIYGISYFILILIVDILALFSCLSLISKIKEPDKSNLIPEYARKTKNLLLKLMVVGIFAFGAGVVI